MTVLGRHLNRGWLGVSVALLLVAPNPALGQTEVIPDNPRLRWEAFHQERAYPFDAIPAGALQRARLTLMATQPGLGAAPPPIVGTGWVPFGPERLPNSKTSTGRLTAIAIHPSNSDIIYVGGANGGVWKTVDGGVSWTPQTDHECSLAMGSIAIDPVDPEIVYAATGEQHFSSGSYYGCGVLRSSNGGATWTQLGASVFVREGANNAKISRIDLDPGTVGSVGGATLLAASDFGLFRSTDGGETWTEVLTGIATDLVRHPTDPQILYSAIRRVGVFKSTDGGTEWNKLILGLPEDDFSRINLALAPSAPDTIFASYQHRTDNNLLGIWKSEDGGENWAKASAWNASCGTQCWYNMAMAVHPTDPQTVFFGGVSLYRSTDGGTSFTDIRDGIHVDQHHFAFDPQNPDIIFVGNDGGIYRSANRGGSWTSLNTNLALTQFYPGISLHPWDGAVVLGGTQDNGTVLSSGTFDFDHVIGGDGGFTAIDFLNPWIRYGETQWKTNSTYGGPRRSDGGSFFRKINGIDISERALFIPPLVMDPVTPSRLYFGTVRLYRTDDRAESWFPITSAFTGRVSTIAPSVSNPSVVYLGTSNGMVQLTVDGGETWKEITVGLPDRYIKDIAVDPGDWKVAYLTVSGYGTDHVFRTADGGESWQDASGNLPDLPVNAVLVDPVESSTVFIGTDLGVFMSEDAGGSWTFLDQGLPNVTVFDLAYNPNTGVLIAGTYGRGMFSLTIDRPLTLAVVPAARADSVLVGSEDMTSDSVTVVMTGPGAALREWTATHEGESWLKLTTSSGTGTSRLTWTRDPTALPPGTFVDSVQVTTPGALDSPFFVVDTLVVEAPRTMTVEPTSRYFLAAVGSTSPVKDTATVTLSGQGSNNAVWRVSHGDAPWVTIETPSRAGSGTAWWARDPSGLAEGTYVDTIVISSVGALGTPAAIVDTLVMASFPVAVDPSTRSGTAPAGSLDPIPDSARVLLSGVGAETAQWTAGSGADSWLTVSTGSGVGPGILRWARDPRGLQSGSYVDTITVESSNGGSAQLIDLFTLTAPWVPLYCSTQHILGGDCLSDFQLRFLDLEGNGDGVFNLGDFLAQLARDGSGQPEKEK